LSELITHAFAPVYDSRSRVLILGTMPSPASRENGFYYSHPRNRFWPVMAALFDVPVPDTPEKKRMLCLENRVALWDVLRACRIEGAADSSIRQPEVNDIPSLLEGSGIAAVFTTGTTASRLYHRHFGHLAVGHIALPSTSPANCRLSLDDLITAYQPIKEMASGGET